MKVMYADFEEFWMPGTHTHTQITQSTTVTLSGLF